MNIDKPSLGQSFSLFRPQSFSVSPSSRRWEFSLGHKDWYFRSVSEYVKNMRGEGGILFLILLFTVNIFSEEAGDFFIFLVPNFHLEVKVVWVPPTR